MTAWIIPSIALAAGLAIVAKSADVFVDGAAGLARRLGAPALVVGMVVVGFGTSAPEMAVSVVGAVRGAPSLALGNAYGSNICNIALILGACALVRPLAVNRSAALTATPALIFVTLVSLVLFRSSTLGPGVSRPDSFILLALFFFALFLMSKDAAKSGSGAEGKGGAGGAVPAAPPLAACLAKTVCGVAVLAGASRVLVWGAVEIAGMAGVSDLVVGLTVVAVGTSLPELASSIAAVRRGEDDLAVGNIVGSNMFNALAVVGLAGAVRPIPQVDGAITGRDIPVSLLLAVFLLFAGAPRRGGGDGVLKRWHGAVLLALYAGYLAILAGAAGAARS